MSGEIRYRKRYNFLKFRYEIVMEESYTDIVDYAYGPEQFWKFVKVLNKTEEILYGEKL